MKVALYQMRWGIDVREASDWMEEQNDRTRITEIVDIDFVTLSKETLDKAQVIQINRQLEELKQDKNELEGQIHALEIMKSEILALPSE